MNERPSEPLLIILREFIRRRGLNTAEVALRLGLERSALRRRLAGEEPLTVDDLMQLGKMLDLKPEELTGMPMGDEQHIAPVTQLPSPRLHLVETNSATLPSNPDDEWAPDPTGNLTLQALRYGFALGIDLFVIFDSTQLEECGVPASVLDQFKERLPIDLPAKYHRHNRPKFEEDGLECILSFDRLYTCFFPWSAFVQIQLKLPKDAVPSRSAPPPPAPAPAPGKAGSHLRVVK